MRRNFLALFMILATMGTIVGAATIEDHPAISRYEGSIPTRRDNDGFRTYRFVTAVNEKGKTDDEVLSGVSVDGEVTRLAYENPSGRSPDEIFANYRQALEKAGYRILFACRSNACGPASASSRWGRVTGMRYFSPEMGYLAARSKQGQGGTYIAVLVAKLRHQVEIVEVSEMEIGKVSAKAISDGMQANGRVVLEGVFFDTDKATIRADSKPALDAIAEYLTGNAAIKVYIVGHTDGTGTLENNDRLSRERAAAVATALQKDFGIASDRLAAHGVGPLSPVDTNQTEAGRARNRRVEMVQR